MSSSFRKIEKDFLDLYGFLQFYGPGNQSATKFGFHKYDNFLFIPTKSNLVRIRREIDRLDQRLGKLDASSLDFYTHLRAKEMSKRLASIRHDLEWNLKTPIYYLRQVGEGLNSLVACGSLSKKKRAERVIKRLSLVPAMLESSKTHVNVTSKRHVQMSHPLAMRLIEYLMNQFPNFGKGLPAGMRNSLVKAASEAVNCINDYVRYLDMIAPSLKDELTLSKQEYEKCLREKYGMNICVDDLRQIGEMEFENWSNKLRELAQSIFPDAKDWRTARLRLSENHAKSDKGIIRDYERAVALNRKFLRKCDAVSLPKGEKVRVLATPVWERMFKGFASCWCTDMIGGKPTSTLWITPSFPGKKPDETYREHYRAQLPEIVSHECYPGHHVHYSNIATHAPLSSKLITRFAGAVIEGWAMFSESVIAVEYGLYDELNMLAMTEKVVWRAARIIIDIDLHTGKISYDEAVQFLTEKVGISKSGAISEVNAHVIEPGNKTKYLYGRLRLLELRERVMKMLGTRYYPKWFHNLIVRSGEISLDGLDELVMHEAGKLLQKQNQSA